MTTFKTATPVKGTDLHFFYFDGLEGPLPNTRSCASSLTSSLATSRTRRHASCP
jgi:hypothetical protein